MTFKKIIIFVLLFASFCSQGQNPTEKPSIALDIYKVDIKTFTGFPDTSKFKSKGFGPFGISYLGLLEFCFKELWGGTKASIRFNTPPPHKFIYYDTRGMNLSKQVNQVKNSLSEYFNFEVTQKRDSQDIWVLKIDYNKKLPLYIGDTITYESGWYIKRGVGITHWGGTDKIPYFLNSMEDELGFFLSCDNKTPYTLFTLNIPYSKVQNIDVFKDYMKEQYGIEMYKTRGLVDILWVEFKNKTQQKKE